MAVRFNENTKADILLGLLQLLGFLDDDGEQVGDGEGDEDEEEYPSNTQLKYTGEPDEEDPDANGQPQK